MSRNEFKNRLSEIWLLLLFRGLTLNFGRVQTLWNERNQIKVSLSNF